MECLGNQSMNNKSTGWVNASKCMGGARLGNQPMNNESTGWVNANRFMDGVPGESIDEQ